MRMGFAVALVAAVVLLVSPAPSAQTFASGQDVQPAFEGWEKNPDGTFNMVFGYLNRNYAEEVNIPIGPNNSIDIAPGGDGGQPTHFYPRRQRYQFSVKVPKDWGNKDVVWTLTFRGKTNKAYGSLLPEYIMGDQVISMNRSGGGAPDGPNEAPKLTLDVTKASVALPNALTLSASATDDGVPKIRPTPPSRPPGRRNALGLRVTWMQYRGPGEVKFDPWVAPNDDHVEGWAIPDFANPAKGKVSTKVTFSEPGTYVIRAMADDGYLFSTQDVTVTVTGAAGSAGAQP